MLFSGFSEYFSKTVSLEFSPKCYGNKVFFTYGNRIESSPILFRAELIIVITQKIDIIEHVVYFANLNLKNS